MPMVALETDCWNATPPDWVRALAFALNTMTWTGPLGASAAVVKLMLLMVIWPSPLVACWEMSKLKELAAVT